MKERAKIKLSIVIVNYNGENYLANCLDSIKKHCASFHYEIIIVDNNSTDKSIALIEDKFSEVMLIKNNYNAGFAKGNNIASNIAKGEYLLLLNNDTILLSDFYPLFLYFENDPNIGALGIKMLDGYGKFIPSFGKFPRPFRLLKLSWLNYNSKEFVNGTFNNDDIVKVNWLSGAFLLTKTSLYRMVNGLDEDYFMYVEDVDFCRKLKNIEKIAIFVPSISFIHYVGFNKSRENLLIKGYSIFATKHFNTFEKNVAKLSLYINYAFKKIFKNIS